MRRRKPWIFLIKSKKYITTTWNFFLCRRSPNVWWGESRLRISYESFFLRTNLRRNKTGTRSERGNAAVVIFEVPPVRPTPVAAAAREEAVHASVVVGRLGDAAALVARRRVEARHSIMARGGVARTKLTRASYRFSNLSICLGKLTKWMPPSGCWTEMPRPFRRPSGCR